jgi:NDP-sugar pyrophosphorylase family protein
MGCREVAPGDEAVTRPLLVIPMTGVSSRFTAAGYDRPKFLLDAEGEHVIDHVIDMYPDWDDVVFICNPIHLDDPRWDLEAHLLARRPRAKVVRADGAARGPGDAVLQARSLIDPDRPVVVNYCDFTVYWDADVLAERLESGDVDGVIPCYSGFHPHMAHSTSYAYVKMDGDRVVGIQEKQPWTSDPSSEWASTGTYAFASGRILFDSLDEQVRRRIELNGEYYLSLTYVPLLEAGGRVEVLPVQHFMQWGTPQDFEEYREQSRAIAAWTGARVVGDVPPPAASSVILASGAGSRFARAGYREPKPLLPLSGRPLIDHVLAATPGEEVIVVTRADLPGNDRIEAAVAPARIVRLEELSRGQAESALRGLEAIRGDGPVTVAACDALPTVTTADFERAVEQAGPDGVIAWVAEPLRSAERSPEQYGWVSSSDGVIDEVWIKSRPSRSAGVMIGTFTFPSARSAITQIRALIDDEDRVNGEFYLDSLVRRAVAADGRAVALTTRTFVSLGTPAEYETVRYWQSCFHKWALHPYTLAADPLVATTAIAKLDADFRRDAVTS